jgi:hypothetical protein
MDLKVGNKRILPVFRIAIFTCLLFCLIIMLPGCLQSKEDTIADPKENMNPYPKEEIAVSNNVLRVRLVNPEIDQEILDQATIYVFDNHKAVVDQVEVPADGEFHEIVPYEDDWLVDGIVVTIVRCPVYADGTTYAESEETITFVESEEIALAFDRGEPCDLTFELSSFEKVTLSKSSLKAMINDKYKNSKMVADGYAERDVLDDIGAITLKRNKWKVEEFEQMIQRLNETDENDFTEIRNIYNWFCSVSRYYRSIDF